MDQCPSQKPRWTTRTQHSVGRVVFAAPPKATRSLQLSRAPSSHQANWMPVHHPLHLSPWLSRLPRHWDCAFLPCTRPVTGSWEPYAQAASPSAPQPGMVKEDPETEDGVPAVTSTPVRGSLSAREAVLALCR